MLLTKLCHDLAGALGAVNNGIEFMEMNDNPELADKATELVKSNALEAVDKLKFYRYLYGISKTDGEGDFSEVKTLADNYFKITNHKIEWNNDGPGLTLTAKGLKLLINMMYMCSKVLPAGGDLKVQYSVDKDKKNLKITAAGEKLIESKEIVHILADHELRDVKLSNVQIHYTAKIATELGAVIKTETKDSEFIMECSFG